MSFHSLVNTRQFSETAIAWKKNGGYYTKAPRGSRDYYQFWEEEDRRCKYGFKCADLWIPGRMYFWLNHFPISRVPEAVMAKALAEGRDKNGRVSVRIAEKTLEFPSFWEIHYEWWNFKHIAWYGGQFMGIHSPGGKHIGCLKTRGAGFSYMEACDGVYNYNFIPGSKSYYFAATEPFLTGDAILDKVQVGLDWVNDNSPYWKQNRKIHNTLMWQKASYYDDQGVERGSMAEIIGQIVDKPSKTRGKRGLKATFEEMGSFPHSEKALEVCLGSLREGNVFVGQASVFGTGGEVGPGIQGLENIFSHPKSWHMLEFPNVWKDGFQHTECGYFVPCWRANSFYMDADGNVDMEGAIAADDEERAIKASSGRPKDLDDRKAEYPRDPDEALQRMTGNGFNIAEIDAQIKRIQSSRNLQGMLRYGDFSTEPTGTNGIQFNPKPKHIARPIEEFPHSQSEDGEKLDLKGCVTILERPYVDQRGRTPAGIYLLTFDPYNKEQSADLTSLWSWKIWKLANRYSTSFIDIPVAWWAGRPVRYEDCHEIMFKGAQMYNAMIQGEIAGGGQSVVTHAKLHRKLNILCNEPETAHNKDDGKKRQVSYLMNMPPDRKRTGITYLEDWHVRPRGLDENGMPILNIHRVYDIAFLREMRKFDPAQGNYDRISDAIPAMYMLKENEVTVAKARKATSANDFYKRELFGANNYEEAGQLTSAY